MVEAAGEEIQVVKPELAPKASPSVPKPANQDGKHGMIDTYKPEYASEAARMVLNGAQERDLCVAFKITKTVLRLWRVQHPEFAAALVISHDNALAIANVERSVYEMAMGYEVDAVKIIHVGEGEIKKVKHTKHIPKNQAAAQYFLENMAPEKWSRRGNDGSLPNDGNPTSITNIANIQGMTTDQLRSLAQALRAAIQPRQSLQRLDATEVETVKVEDGSSS